MTQYISNRFATDRAITFLNESNQIEGIHEIDYNLPRFQDPTKGHFGAFVASQKLALDRKPLDIKTIAIWQAMLTREQKSFGHNIEENEIGHIRGPSVQKNVRVGNHIPPRWEYVPTLLSYWVEDLNEALKNPEKDNDDVNYCKRLGEFFQRFESIHPFADGNGRTGRLIANYIATYSRRPILVFNSEMSEKNQYYEAHKSEKAMCVFMASKVKEAVFGLDGDLLLRSQESSDSTLIYENTTQTKAEVIEWHALDAQVRKWAEMPPPEEQNGLKRKRSSEFPNS